MNIYASNMSSSSTNSQKSPSKDYRSKNYVYAIQNICVNPEKAFQLIRNNPRHSPSCTINKPLVRVRDLVPNVIYNIKV